MKIKYTLLSSIIFISIYFTAFTQISTEELIAYYPFNGNANDESGYGNHGIVNGAVLSSDRFNNVNNAYYFDGSSNIKIMNSSFFNEMDIFCISVWVYPTEVKYRHNSIISKVNPNRDFNLKILEDNMKYEAHFAYGATYYRCYSKNEIKLNTWTHLVYEWTGTKWLLYINGVFDNEADHTGITPPWTGTIMAIGSMNNTEFFTGKIDEVRIYKRVLTDDEIISLYRYEEQKINITGVDQVCQGQQDVMYSAQGIETNSYKWNFSGNGVTISGNSENVQLDFTNNSTSGILSVTAIKNIDTSYSDELYIHVDSLPPPIGAIIGENNVCKNFNNVYYVNPVNEIQNYIWHFSEEGVQIVNNDNNAIITFSQVVSGELIVSGQNNCGIGESSPAFSILVDPCELNIPNSFSPNGDNINDIFYIRNLPEGSKILIFNRLGKLLYSSDNYKNDWDGKDMDKNNLDTDVYWYVLRISGLSDEFKGFVYLKR